jgi:hypothetical protein
VSEEGEKLNPSELETATVTLLEIDFFNATVKVLVDPSSQ